MQKSSVTGPKSHASQGQNEQNDCLPYSVESQQKFFYFVLCLMTFPASRSQHLDCLLPYLLTHTHSSVFRLVIVREKALLTSSQICQILFFLSSFITLLHITFTYVVTSKIVIIGLLPLIRARHMRVPYQESWPPSSSF